MIAIIGGKERSAQRRRDIKEGAKTYRHDVVHPIIHPFCLNSQGITERLSHRPPPDDLKDAESMAVLRHTATNRVVLVRCRRELFLTVQADGAQPGPIAVLRRYAGLDSGAERSQSRPDPQLKFAASAAAHPHAPQKHA